jgi:hypothetical protein
LQWEYGDKVRKIIAGKREHACKLGKQGNMAKPLWGTREHGEIFVGKQGNMVKYFWGNKGTW